MEGVCLIYKEAVKPADKRYKDPERNGKMRILVVEDDLTIQTQLKTLLSGNGYEVDTVNDFSRVMEKFKVFAPNLVLLDIKLPGNNGFEICSQIRSLSDIPIVFVTSSNTDMDELNSIMLGGDAFITKPYNTAILLAKIASLLRRAYASGQSETLTWNGADLHLESSFIEYNGQKADLTKNELKILYYLFKNAGKICPRSDIVDFLWDNQLYVDDNALSVNINRIREKLVGIGLTDFIKTKHRQGYTI
jgi:DNA-binding response OmpR family regulator